MLCLKLTFGVTENCLDHLILQTWTIKTVGMYWYLWH